MVTEHDVRSEGQGGRDDVFASKSSASNRGPAVDERRLEPPVRRHTGEVAFHADPGPNNVASGTRDKWTMSQHPMQSPTSSRSMDSRSQKVRNSKAMHLCGTCL
jgi:hypothetical protein